MGRPVDFLGSNMTLGPPSGRDELSVQTVRSFTNGVHSVTCWELTDEEIEEIVRTRRVFISIISGKTQPPVYVGIEQDTRDLIADVGTWRRV